ncbi:MAG: hypothetical protein R2788_04565 [Saprospiraceae bacterium]
MKRKIFTQFTCRLVNSIEVADLDGNGLNDFIVGNLGLNYKYKASPEKPFTIYGKDSDKADRMILLQLIMEIRFILFGVVLVRRNKSPI